MMKIWMPMAVLCLCVAGCAGTTDDQFARDVRLHFAASPRYDRTKTVFWLTFSTVGRTVWPGDSKLTLLVDEKQTRIPTQWSRHVVIDHILPNAPRGAGWWMEPEEIRNWIGSGNHSLQFQFRNVTSNVLKVNLPDEGPVQCDPEYVNSAWSKRE